MKENYTHIAIILDRSGSMSSMSNDVIGGFDNFIATQKENEGEATLSLCQFDNQYDVVHDFININEVPSLIFQPRGGTALLDAMGRTIEEVRATILAMSDDEMPSKVIFVTITDGYENQSREFTRDRVFEMISELQSDEREDKVNWEFVFIGANQDAISAGNGFGIRADASLSYAASGAGASAAFDSLSSGVTMFRSMASTDACYTFSDDDRIAQEDLGATKTDMSKLAKEANYKHRQIVPDDLVADLDNIEEVEEEK